MKKTRIYKFVSAILIAALVLSDLARANPVLVSPSSVEANPRLEFSLPPELGSVQKIYFPEDRPNAPFVFHIETVHANYQAALKVKEIIQFLSEKYGSKLIFSEGGVGPLQPKFLSFFPDPSLNQKMLDALAQKGELTGVDLVLANKNLGVQGIEQANLYRRAFKDFNKVIQNSEANKAFVEKQKGQLDKLASKIFSVELRGLLEAWQKFELNHRDFSATLRFLQQKAGESLDLDLTNPFSQFEWPQVSRLLFLEQIQKQMNPEKLVVEKKRLKTWLHEKKLPEDFVEGLDSKDLKSPREYFEDFVRQTYARGFQFKDYPQITYHASFRVIESELEPRIVFDEIEKLFEKLFEVKAVKDEEKELLKQYRNLELTQKLLALELTCEQWSVIAPQGLSRSLKRNIMEGIAPQSQSFEIASVAPLPHNDITKQALHFYHLTQRRELIFLDILQKEMKARGLKKAILVTGGFHSAGMGELFKKEGMGYASISPRMSGEVDGSLYHQLMLRSSHLDKPEFAAPAQLFGNYNYYRSEFRSVTETAREISSSFDRDAPYFLDRASFLNRRPGASQVRAEVHPNRSDSGTPQSSPERARAEVRSEDPFSFQWVVSRSFPADFVEMTELWRKAREVSKLPEGDLQEEIVSDEIHLHYANEDLRIEKSSPRKMQILYQEKIGPQQDGKISFDFAFGSGGLRTHVIGLTLKNGAFEVFLDAKGRIPNSGRVSNLLHSLRFEKGILHLNFDLRGLPRPADQYKGFLFDPAVLSALRAKGFTLQRLKFYSEPPAEARAEARTQGNVLTSEGKIRLAKDQVILVERFRDGTVKLLTSDGQAAEAREGRPIFIGRQKESDLHIKTDNVSIFHATVRREGEGVFVEDIGSKGQGSTNGTFLLNPQGDPSDETQWIRIPARRPTEVPMNVLWPAKIQEALEKNDATEAARIYVNHRGELTNGERKTWRTAIYDARRANISSRAEVHPNPTDSGTPRSLPDQARAEVRKGSEIVKGEKEKLAGGFESGEAPVEYLKVFFGSQGLYSFFKFFFGSQGLYSFFKLLFSSQRFNSFFELLFSSQGGNNQLNYGNIAFNPVQFFQLLFNAIQPVLYQLKAFAEYAELALKIFQNDAPLALARIIGTFFGWFRHRGGSIERWGVDVNFILSNINLNKNRIPASTRAEGFGSAQPRPSPERGRFSPSRRAEVRTEEKLKPGDIYANQWIVEEAMPLARSITEIAWGGNDKNIYLVRTQNGEPLFLARNHAATPGRMNLLRLAGLLPENPKPDFYVFDYHSDLANAKFFPSKPLNFDDAAQMLTPLIHSDAWVGPLVDHDLIGRHFLVIPEKWPFISREEDKHLLTDLPDTPLYYLHWYENTQLYDKATSTFHASLKMDAVTGYVLLQNELGEKQFSIKDDRWPEGLDSGKQILKTLPVYTGTAETVPFDAHKAPVYLSFDEDFFHNGEDRVDWLQTGHQFSSQVMVRGTNWSVLDSKDAEKIDRGLEGVGRFLKRIKETSEALRERTPLGVEIILSPGFTPYQYMPSITRGLLEKIDQGLWPLVKDSKGDYEILQVRPRSEARHVPRTLAVHPVRLAPSTPLYPDRSGPGAAVQSHWDSARSEARTKPRAAIKHLVVEQADFTREHRPHLLDFFGEELKRASVNLPRGKLVKTLLENQKMRKLLTDQLLADGFLDSQGKWQVDILKVKLPEKATAIRLDLAKENRESELQYQDFIRGEISASTLFKDAALAAMPGLLAALILEYLGSGWALQKKLDQSEERRNRAQIVQIAAGDEVGFIPDPEKGKEVMAKVTKTDSKDNVLTLSYREKGKWIEKDVAAGQVRMIPKALQVSRESLMKALIEEKDPAGKLQIAETAGLDTRPIRYGLLDPLYVYLDMKEKEIVNPNNWLLRGRYKGAGADLSNYLLSTNIPEVDFESQDFGISVNDLKKIRNWDPKAVSANQDYAQWRHDYLSWKYKTGHAGLKELDRKEKVLNALVLELEALGVDLSQTRAELDSRGYPTLRFRWTYPGESPKIYSVSFINVSAETHLSYAPSIITKSYDLYYQRAGMRIPFAYKNEYFEEIYDSVRPGGFFVTDDHALVDGPSTYADLGKDFPQKYKEISVSIPEELHQAVVRMRIGFALHGNRQEAGNRYGWYMRIRQKPFARSEARAEIKTIWDPSQKKWLVKYANHVVAAVGKSEDGFSEVQLGSGSKIWVIKTAVDLRQLLDRNDLFSDIDEETGRVGAVPSTPTEEGRQIKDKFSTTYADIDKPQQIARVIAEAFKQGLRLGGPRWIKILEEKGKALKDLPAQNLEIEGIKLKVQTAEKELIISVKELPGQINFLSLFARFANPLGYPSSKKMSESMKEIFRKGERFFWSAGSKADTSKRILFRFSNVQKDDEIHIEKPAQRSEARAEGKSNFEKRIEEIMAKGEGLTKEEVDREAEWFFSYYSPKERTRLNWAYQEALSSAYYLNEGIRSDLQMSVRQGKEVSPALKRKVERKKITLIENLPSQASTLGPVDKLNQLLNYVAVVQRHLKAHAAEAIRATPELREEFLSPALPFDELLRQFQQFLLAVEKKERYTMFPIFQGIGTHLSVQEAKRVATKEALPLYVAPFLVMRKAGFQPERSPAEFALALLDADNQAERIEFHASSREAEPPWLVLRFAREPKGVETRIFPFFVLKEKLPPLPVEDEGTKEFIQKTFEMEEAKLRSFEFSEADDFQKKQEILERLFGLLVEEKALVRDIYTLFSDEGVLRLAKTAARSADETESIEFMYRRGLKVREDAFQEFLGQSWMRKKVPTKEELQRKLLEWKQRMKKEQDRLVKEEIERKAKAESLAFALKDLGLSQEGLAAHDFEIVSLLQKRKAVEWVRENSFVRPLVWMLFEKNKDQTPVIPKENLSNFIGHLLDLKPEIQKGNLTSLMEETQKELSPELQPIFRFELLRALLDSLQTKAHKEPGLNALREALSRAAARDWTADLSLAPTVLVSRQGELHAIEVEQERLEKELWALFEKPASEENLSEIQKIIQRKNALSERRLRTIPVEISQASLPQLRRGKGSDWSADLEILKRFILNAASHVGDRKESEEKERAVYQKMVELWQARPKEPEAFLSQLKTIARELPDTGKLKTQLRAFVEHYQRLYAEEVYFQVEEAQEKGDYPGALSLIEKAERLTGAPSELFKDKKKFLREKIEIQKLGIPEELLVGAARLLTERNPQDRIIRSLLEAVKSGEREKIEEFLPRYLEYWSKPKSRTRPDYDLVINEFVNKVNDFFKKHKPEGRSEARHVPRTPAVQSHWDSARSEARHVPRTPAVQSHWDSARSEVRRAAQRGTLPSSSQSDARAEVPPAERSGTPPSLRRLGARAEVRMEESGKLKAIEMAVRAMAEEYVLPPTIQERIRQYLLGGQPLEQIVDSLSISLSMQRIKVIEFLKEAKRRFEEAMRAQGEFTQEAEIERKLLKFIADQIKSGKSEAELKKILPDIWPQEIDPERIKEILDRARGKVLLEYIIKEIITARYQDNEFRLARLEAILRELVHHPTPHLMDAIELLKSMIPLENSIVDQHGADHSRELEETVQNAIAALEQELRSRSEVRSYAEYLAQRNPEAGKKNITSDWKKDALNYTEPSRHWEIFEFLREVRGSFRDKGIKVLVLGPGTQEIQKGVSISPQVLEILAMMNRDRSIARVEMNLVDFSKEVLKTAASGEAYQQYRFETKALGFAPPEKRDGLLDEIKNSIAPVLKKTGTDQLQDKGIYEVDQEKLFQKSSLHGFEARFQDLDYGRGKVNLIIATASLEYAIYDLRSWDQKVELFAKLIGALVPGGRLLTNWNTFVNGGVSTMTPKDLKAFEKEIRTEFGLSIQIKTRGSMVEITRLRSRSEEYPNPTDSGTLQSSRRSGARAEVRALSREELLFQMDQLLKAHQPGMLLDLLRGQAGLRQSDLEHQSKISRIESGESRPSSETLAKIIPSLQRAYRKDGRLSPREVKDAIEKVFGKLSREELLTRITQFQRNHEGGALLRLLREQAGLAQGDLGVSVTVSAIELGRLKLSSKSQARILPLLQKAYRKEKPLRLFPEEIESALREAFSRAEVRRFDYAIRDEITKLSLWSRTSFPFQALDGIWVRSERKDFWTSLGQGGWIRKRIIPSVPEGERAAKSLSWVMMANFSFWARLKSSLSLAPDGARSTEWPSERRRESMEPEDSVGLIEREVLEILRQLGRVMQGRTDMIASQAGVGFEDLLIARAAFQELQNQMDHDPAGFAVDPEAWFAMTYLGINRDEFFNERIHAQKLNMALSQGQADGSLPPIISRRSETRAEEGRFEDPVWVREEVNRFKAKLDQAKAAELPEILKRMKEFQDKAYEQWKANPKPVEESLDLLTTYREQTKKQIQKSDSLALLKGLSRLISKLDVENWGVNRAAATALGPVYAELVKQGKMTLESLESKLSDPDWDVSQAAAIALGPAYAEQLKQGKLTDEDLEKLIAWLDGRLPLEEKILEESLTRPLQSFIPHYRAKLALKTLGDFLEKGDVMHERLDKLRQKGLYNDPVYNRAITAQAAQRGWASWQTGSIYVTSYGLLEETPEPLKIFPSPTGAQIRTQTQLHLESGKVNPQGYQKASLQGKQKENFLLYDPGYKDWKSFQEDPKKKEDSPPIFLLGVAPNGSKAFYLTSWGEAISCCTLYGDFESNWQAVRHRAHQYFDSSPQFKKLWHELQVSLPEEDLKQGKAIIPKDVQDHLLQSRPDLFKTKQDVLRFFQEGLSLYFINAFEAFQFAMNGQYYNKVSGHAEALNQRIRQVLGEEPATFLKDIPSSGLPKITFAIGKETAENLGLKQGAFREEIPVSNPLNLLAFLETEGFIPKTGLPSPEPLFEQPGQSQEIFHAIDQGKLTLWIKPTPESSWEAWQGVELWEKPFPEGASVMLRLTDAGAPENGITSSGRAEVPPAERPGTPPSSPRSEARAEVRREAISFGSPIFMATDGGMLMPIAARFVLDPFPFVTAVELGGFENPNWKVEIRESFRSFLEAAANQITFASQDPEEMMKKIESLKNASRDGVGIKSITQSVSQAPIILQIDSSSLDSKDKESIVSRLALLPQGSVVVEYVEKGKAQDVFGPVMKNFPGLHYFRKTYDEKIKLESLREELQSANKNFKVDLQNSGMLISDMTKIEKGSFSLETELKNLGVVFQFDPQKLPEKLRVLNGLSGAVFGELTQYTKLDREVRERLMAQNQASGLMGFHGGFYSLNLDLWLDLRTSQLIASAA